MAAKSAGPSTFERIRADVLSYIAEHPGCRRSEVTAVVTGSNGGISGAVMRLLDDGRLVERGRRLYVAGSAPGGRRSPVAGSAELKE